MIVDTVREVECAGRGVPPVRSQPSLETPLLVRGVVMAMAGQVDYVQAFV